MARPIVLGNGKMHVGINNYGLVHDVYFPYVGLENHTIGHGTRHRVGVWIDGELSWLDDGTWDIHFEYPHMALVGHVTARSTRMAVVLEFDDTVDADMSVFMRNVHVINTSTVEREIRVFMHQAFVIGDSRGNTDTVQYLPDTDAIMHYRGRRVFIVSGECDGEPFDQFTTGLFGIEGHEGCWRDADDGELSGCTAEHGRVDSVLRFSRHVAGLNSYRLHYWMAAGVTIRDALDAHKRVKEVGVVARLHDTLKYWQHWLEPAMKTADVMPTVYRRQFLRSAMILKSHIDHEGAIIASTDSAMLNYGRDAYAYCWPRDGAYVLWPLVRMGYRDEALKFFDFCCEALHPNGYLSHKYRADGALGSSWHSYVHEDGVVAPPIQHDESALVIFVLIQFYHQQQDQTILDTYYECLIKPVARYLAGAIDDATHLPRPSYDLWEQIYATSTYTTAVTYAALVEASEIAEMIGDDEHAVSWRAIADDIAQAAARYLYSEERRCLVKHVTLHDDTVVQDTTIDVSAIFGSFMFGLFGTNSRIIRDSIATMREVFDQEHTIGLPRYEDDAYRRPAGQSTPNLWHITTLWYAQYCIETGELDTAENLLNWVQQHAYESGVLAEQIAANGFSKSVAPLAWSHAEFMATLLDLSHARSRESS
ncbi:hypothetical protein CR983_04290 [Candidatus Saccharibacteria bacterium]|nr:MAG: hypothetical protein CR983_04290 [Candidatus Saccharibacteria bacterium]